MKGFDDAQLDVELGLLFMTPPSLPPATRAAPSGVYQRFLERVDARSRR